MTPGKYSRRAFLTGVLATGALSAAAVSAVPGGRIVPVRLRYITAGDSTGAHHFLVDMWNYAHPDTVVELHEVGGASNDQLKEMAIAAQQGADVLNLDMIHIPYFADHALIQEIEVDPPTIEAFIETTLSACTWNICTNSERSWALPFNTDAGVLFERVHGDSDANPAGLSRVMDHLTKGSKAFAGQLAPSSSSQWEGFVVNVMEHALSRNQNILDAKSGMPIYDRAAWQRALEPLRTSIESGSVDACPDEGGTTDHFIRGRMPFMRNWPSRYRDLQTRHDPDVLASRIRLSPLPAGILGGQSLTLGAKTRYLSRARDFIHFLISEPAQNIAAAYGLLAARASVYQEGNSNLTALIPNLAQLKGIVEQARPRPIHPNYPLFSGVVAKYVMPFLQSGTDLPGEFVDEMRSVLNDAGGKAC